MTKTAMSLSITLLSMGLLGSVGYLQPSNILIEGSVRTRDDDALEGIRVAVYRDGRAVAEVESDSNGDYGVGLPTGGPVDVYYESFDYSPEILFRLSGVSDHRIVKVLSTEGGELLMAGSLGLRDRFVVARGTSVGAVDRFTGETIYRNDVNGPVLSVAVNPSGELIAALIADRPVLVLDGETGEYVAESPDGLGPTSARGRSKFLLFTDEREILLPGDGGVGLTWNIDTGVVAEIVRLSEPWAVSGQ